MKYKLFETTSITSMFMWMVMTMTIPTLIDEIIGTYNWLIILLVLMIALFGCVLYRMTSFIKRKEIQEH